MLLIYSLYCHCVFIDSSENIFCCSPSCHACAKKDPMFEFPGFGLEEALIICSIKELTTYFHDDSLFIYPVGKYFSIFLDVQTFDRSVNLDYDRSTRAISRLAGLLPCLSQLSRTLHSSVRPALSIAYLATECGSARKGATRMLATVKVHTVCLSTACLETCYSTNPQRSCLITDT
jgi:hypothetical protein